MPFDFKAAAPDATVAATAYLFGADSQAAATPSLYEISAVLALIAAAGSSGQVQYNSAGSFAGANVWREDANTLALRNGATAQSLYDYNTYTDASNYERGFFSWASNVLKIGAEKAGTGTERELQLWQRTIERIFAVQKVGADYNVCVGPDAGIALTTGFNNVFIGDDAGKLATGSYANFALGAHALQSVVGGAWENVCIGTFAAQNATGIQYSVFIGNNSGNSLIAGLENTCVGGQAGWGSGATPNVNGTCAFGYQALASIATNGDNNTAMGLYSGYAITTGARNVLLGCATIAASYNQISTGSRNIAIGNDVAVASATANEQLCIGNAIYGTGLGGTGSTISTCKIGIKVKAPGSIFEVNGDIYANMTTAITTSQPAIMAQQTWNAAGVAFTLAKFNATNTASAAGSLLLDLQLGAASMFSVGKTGDVTLADAANIIVNATTGTKIGTATTQKLGFWNATPVAQQSGTGETTGFTAGAGTAVNDASTFTGNVGATAYRINDVVKALKNVGLLAA